ncbi:MAG: hypothetical protein KDK96_09550 [Chlamydiia bacterium]|nr:hypothetical protein [Chlamydiia bacterium]
MNFNQIKISSFNINFTHSNNFKFFSCSSVFFHESYLALQQAFTNLPWKNKQTEFYKQYEAVISPNQNNPLSFLYKKVFYLKFKKKIEKVLKTKLRNESRIIAHKLVTAGEIDIYNDYCNPILDKKFIGLFFRLLFLLNQLLWEIIIFFKFHPKKSITKNTLIIKILEGNLYLPLNVYDNLGIKFYQ